jgi:hypothetical protein
MINNYIQNEEIVEIYASNCFTKILRICKIYNRYLYIES